MSHCRIGSHIALCHGGIGNVLEALTRLEGSVYDGRVLDDASDKVFEGKYYLGDMGYSNAHNRTSCRIEARYQSFEGAGD